MYNLTLLSRSTQRVRIQVHTERYTHRTIAHVHIDRYRKRRGTRQIKRTEILFTRQKIYTRMHRKIHT